MAVKEQVSLPSQRICSRCKFVSSQEVCKACILLEGLNKGLPKLGIGKSSKAKRMLEEYERNQGEEQLKQTVSELSDDINSTISEGKDKTCKSGACKKGNKGMCAQNTHENIDKKNNMSNMKCANKCSNKCNCYCNPDNNDTQSETKTNRLLKEFSIKETDQALDNTNGISEVANKIDIEKCDSDEELQKEEESCVGGCEGMAISF